MTTSPLQPTTPAPTPSAGVGIEGLLSTENVRSSYDALKQLDVLTNVIEGENDVNSIYVIVTDDEIVISEGQVYALMIAGIALAAMDPNDPNRQDTMDRFYGYFKGWEKMCQLSTLQANCQSEKFCNG